MTKRRVKIGASSEVKTPEKVKRGKKAAVILGKGGASQFGWHKIESMLTCPKEYQFAHVRQIVQPMAQVPDYFAVGQMYHAGRARLFANHFATTEASWNSIAAAVREAALENKLPVSLKAEQRALTLLQAYAAHYSKRPKATPVAAEYLVGPQEILPGDPATKRTARLDDVSRYPEAGGALCVGESKTTSTSIQDCINQYTLHGQTMLQFVLWKLCPNGEAKHGPAAGIMLDVVKKGYGGEAPAFGRQFIPVTDFQLSWFAPNLARYLKIAEAISWDTEVPRNVQACTRLIGRARVACRFRDMCQHGRSASVKFVFEDGKQLTTWRPEPGKEVAPWL